MFKNLNNRTAAYQGLRIVAIILIVILHAGKVLVDIGCVVSFFFVLSGFLSIPQNDIRQFYKEKFLKIFPVYWITFFIDFFLNDRTLQFQIFPHLLLVQTYWPMPSPGCAYYDYLGVGWFLSSLLFCYLLTPLSYKYIRILTTSNKCFLLIFVLALMWFVSKLPIPEQYQNWVWYVSPYWRFLEYVSGILVGSLVKNAPVQQMRWKELFGVLVVCGYFALMIFYRETYFWTIPNLLLIAFLYLYNPNGIHNVFGNEIAIRFSSYIMPVFLIHEVFMPSLQQWGGWIIVSILSLVISSGYAVLITKLLSLINKRKNVR